jgi:multiple sugar transport system substrate-binding protein
VALGAVALAACGSSSSSNKSTTGSKGGSSSSGGVTDITMWHQETANTATALNTMVKGFNASQHKYHISAQYIASPGTSETAFTAKLATAAKSNSGPQLVWGDSEPNYVPELISTGDVVPLSQFLNTSGSTLTAADFNQAMLQTGTFNGKVWAIPCDGGDYAIFYNKQLFKAAGITSTPTTWAELTSDAQKLTKGGVYGFYVPWGTAEWTVWTYESMLWAAGGQLLNASNTKAEFDSPQGVAGLDVWLNLLKNKQAYPSNLANSTQSSGYPGFQDKKIAMYIDGAYDIPLNDKALGASNVGVFAFPAIKTPAMNVGTNSALIMKGTKAQEDGSWAFLKYALSPSVEAQYDVTSGFIPVVTATSSNSIYKKYLASDPRLSVFTEELKYAHTRPSIAKYEAVSTVLGQQLEEAFMGQKSASQALSTAAAQANKLLAG